MEAEGLAAELDNAASRQPGAQTELQDLNNTYCAILIQLLFSSTCLIGILVLNVVNVLAPAPTLSTNTGNGTHTRSSTRANLNAR